MKKVFLLIALVWSTHILSAQDAPPPISVEDSKANPTTEVFKKDRVSLQYPKGWEVNDSGKMGTTVIILSPLESQADKFRENVNVLINDVPSNVSLEEFTDMNVKGLQRSLQDANITDNKTITVKGQKMQMLRFNGFQNGYKLAWKQYYTLRNGKSYIITFTAEQNRFSSFERVCNNILNSFVVE